MTSHHQSLLPPTLRSESARRPIPQPKSRAAPTARPDHRLLSYRNRRELVRTTLSFLRAGHKAGERMFVVTEEQTIKALQARLPADARIDWADSVQWYGTPGQTMSTLHDWLAQVDDPGTGVRLVTEPPWRLLSVESRGEWACFESALNVVMSGRPIRVLCPYRLDTVPSAVLADAHAAHPRLADPAGVRSCTHWIDPRLFAPAGESGMAPVPPSATHAGLHDSTPADLARFATRQAFERGVFGKAARNFGLAAHEAAAEFFPTGRIQAEAYVWTQGRELVCELTFRTPHRPRVLGYVPPVPEADESGRLWTARRLCRLVRLRPTDNGMLVRLHLPFG